MMPLTEISNNIRRSASHAREKAASDGGSLSPSSLPTSAIRSMLKTTTELGDLGQFAVRPAKLPRSGTRHLSTRPRSGLFDAAFASALRHERSSQGRRHGRPHGPRPFNSSSGISGRNISQTNLSSSTNASRRRRYPPVQYQHTLQGHASPGPGPRRLHHHRSLLSLSTRSSLQSRSPVLVPSRMRAPGYQASSSYSDVRHLSHTPRPGFMRAPSIGTIGASPASLRPRPHGAPGYRPDVNGSYTSLVRLPSPAVSFNRNGPYPGPVPIRTPTPTSMMSHQQHSMATNHSIGGIPKSPTGSPVPRYYDYSESFLEEDCFSPDDAPEVTQPPLNMDQTILNAVPTPPPRDAQTPFGTMAGSTFHPIELPTQHSRRLSDQSVPSFTGVISKRVSSLGAPALHKSSPRVVRISEHPKGQADQPQCQIRRTQSENSGPSDLARADQISRRPSIVSRRSCTPSRSSIFFQSASRSSRDLMTMAARVHSPLMGKDKLAHVIGATLQNKQTVHKSLSASIKRSGRYLRPSLSPFVFSGISFEYYRPSPSARPRTSEATPIRKIPEILSPMPERPMSSQSWMRFNKILEIDDTNNSTRGKSPQQSFSHSKPAVLDRVDEAAGDKHSGESDGPMRDDGIGSPVSLPAPDDAAFNQRISQVASHDESSFGSLLDRHIECLGLQPEALQPKAESISDSAMTTDEIRSPVSCPMQNDSGLNQGTDQVASPDSSSIDSLLDSHMECLGLQQEANVPDTATSSESCQKDRRSSADDAVNLTDLLATAPVWETGRPTTSSSCRHPSLAPFERQRLKPRKLFASMDAGLPETILERSTTTFSTNLENPVRTSRPSYGWQTLPSTTHLISEASMPLPSLNSGELADVDSPEQEKKFKVRRRSNLSMSASEPSHLSKNTSGILTPKQKNGVHQRSKSTVLASQESHRQRLLRIRLKLKTKSRTIGDITVDGFTEFEVKPEIKSISSERASSCQGNTQIPAECYADLSWETVTPSKTASPRPQSPVIPTRGSSVVANVPESVERRTVLSPEVSMRTVKSRRPDASIIEPVNGSRISAPSPSLGAVPRLATPQFGPDLTSSELNLSLPYEDVPSSTRPILRETKSFFWDDSSRERQRTSIRQKLHLHSLRRVLPGSASHNASAHSFNGGTVNFSHSCQARGRNSEEEKLTLPADTTGISDFMYRKRKVLERLKGWWRRQCMSRIHRRRGERTAPGAVN